MTVTRAGDNPWRHPSGAPAPGRDARDTFFTGSTLAGRMSREEPPAAVTAACPDCGEDTLHSVLHGRVGTRGEVTTLDATVECTDCGRTHHVLLREAKDVTVPAVLSDVAGQSRRTTVDVPGDAELTIGEAFIVDGINSVLTGIETRDMRRVDEAEVKDVATLWFKEFEEILVGFAINMGHKTITKTLPSPPEREFSVGEEHVFGRLRITVHAIKTTEALLKRGTASAGNIVRIFARPTPLGTTGGPRPDKRTREQMREKEEGRARRRR
jgi:uncharacterized Zn finger protein